MLIEGIPYELSALEELTFLNLFINKLHGEIPHFIADLARLENMLFIGGTTSLQRFPHYREWLILPPQIWEDPYISISLSGCL